MKGAAPGGRPRATLRGRTYAVVLAVVAAPLAVVAVADRSGASEMTRMEALVARASVAVASEIGRGGDAQAAAEREAAGAGVRVLVIGADGGSLASADHEAQTSLRDRIGDALFGPEGAPTLQAFDAQRPAGAAWPEVETARRAGRSAGCEIGLSGTIAVCHSAALVPGKDGAVVLAQKSSPRAIRALFDLRYPLLKLTLYVLAIGALLSAWLGRRIVAPVERLRGEVLERAADPLRAAPIPRVSRDEIGDLGEAFNALLAALVAKSRANEAFAADLAHELKSPIAALRACADGLSGPLSAERAERLARVLSDSTARLDALVSRFLEIARAEAGLPNEERTVIDAAALVRGLLAAASEDERHAGVRFDATGESAPIEGAAGPLESALRNIVENAASFAGEGGWVRARVEGDAGGVAIEIADSGPGIAPESLPRVFDRFFTDRPGGKGTGLGLAYARAVVEAHGGSITAASPPGSGAVFKVWLPAVSRRFHARSADDSPGRQG